MLDPIFQTALVRALLHSLWQDALLGLLAAAILRLPRHGAARRHTLGMAFLIAMLVVPLLTLLNGLGAGQTASLILLAPFGPQTAHAFAVDGAAPTSAFWLGGLWALGSGAMLARLLAGVAVIRQLDRQPLQPLPAAWQGRVDMLRQRLGIHRPVAIGLLDIARPPCTAHVLRPVIWLPVSILTGLDPDQIEAVIAHELAHIRRLDWVWNGLQCVIEALLFYHPAMWWLSRRIREERENACDDLAASACGDPIVLAEALSLLAGLRTPAPRFVLSTNGSPLMKRTTRLLTPRVKEPLGWKLPLGLLALGCTGAVLALTAVPTAQGQSVEVPHWWEQFGNAMTINATIDGKHRSYRRWHDLRGQPHESYAIDGRPAPIDAGVRQWLAQALIHPLPPLPPKPPAAPSITDDAVFRSAVAQLAADPALIARIGAPITVQGTAGPSYIDAFRADLSLRISGPRGSVRLHRTGTAEDGQWRFSTAAIEPLDAATRAR